MVLTKLSISYVGHWPPLRAVRGLVSTNRIEREEHEAFVGLPTTIGSISFQGCRELMKSISGNLRQESIQALSPGEAFL